MSPQLKSPPTLQEGRSQQRLTFLYKVVKGHVPAINIEHFLKTQRPKRTIRAKQFEDFIKRNNVENSICNNSQCFKPRSAKTENFKHSYFVRTVIDCSKLCDSAVNADFITSFSLNNIYFTTQYICIHKVTSFRREISKSG